MSKQNAEIGQITMELDIDATPERVWQALTDDIDHWWPAEFYAGGEHGKRRFVLEAQPGGRMYEQWDYGGGVLWGTVICADPNTLLQVVGFSLPNWGGPSQSYNTWELKANGNGTTLIFSESTLGRVTDSSLAEKDQGWNFLWLTLKAHLEDQPPPQWQD